MSAENDTNFNSAVFLLSGIPGQEDVYLWISIPFCLMYVISIVGNSIILFIIKIDASLHEPMYIFLSMLAVTDLGLSIVTIPTILGIYLFNSREISLHACFTQLFFIHLLAKFESSVLLLMAFDRFIAICNPLRYATILTPQIIAKMGLAFMLRGVVVIFPLPFLLKRFRYCRDNVLSHSYCVHQEVMKMACSDITVNSMYGLCTTLLTVGLDSLLIFLSYVMILKTVLNIVSKVECLRTLNTCISHLCSVLLFYMPEIGLAVTHRFGNSSSHLLQMVLGYFYLLVPPLINPIVYSVKSKHLRERIIRAFVKWRVSSSLVSRAGHTGNKKHSHLFHAGSSSPEVPPSVISPGQKPESGCSTSCPESQSHCEAPQTLYILRPHPGCTTQGKWRVQGSPQQPVLLRQLLLWPESGLAGRWSIRGSGGAGGRA